VDGCGRLLVVQKTGWGKSFVYFIATKLLREGGSGPSLLISPLLALMRNQIAAAERMGVRAVTINSDNEDEWDNVEEAIRRNQVDILLISPERLVNERFRTQVLASIAANISLLVIDEAHCISDWGHDFRPHYRLLERMVRTLPRSLRLLATTATANNRVMDDLTAVLGPNITVSRGDLNRPSLFLQTIRLPSQAERMAWLAAQVPLLPGHGIIYTLTVRDAVQVANWLKSRGLNIESYTGETGERRAELEQALLENRVKALVATTALGMGYDKPDLGFVIHYQTPGSVVAYYQQVGRAGRALDAAYGVLLSGQEETDITDFFIVLQRNINVDKRHDFVYYQTC
jgi:ATP-dependent DNA helicase RecQ